MLASWKMRFLCRSGTLRPDSPFDCKHCERSKHQREGGRLGHSGQRFESQIVEGERSCRGWRVCESERVDLARKGEVEIGRCAAGPGYDLRLNHVSAYVQRIECRSAKATGMPSRRAQTNHRDSEPARVGGNV